MIKLIKSIIVDNKYLLGIIGILAIAVFFRFYHLFDLQYYSFDDEMHTMVLRRIAIDKKLVLLSPNPTLAISLGSFWHLLSAPLLYLVNFNPVKLLTIGSLFGVITTYILYLTGKEIYSKRVGLIAAFLYSASFLMVLADRRWWPLSLNPFLITTAIFSLSKMIKGKLIYSFPLSVAISFAWHADPTLAIVSLAVFICLIIFRLPLLHRQYIPAIFFILISISPFFISEIRHKGSVSYPVQEMFGRLLNKGDASRSTTLPLGDITIGLTHSLFATPSQTAEEYMNPHTGSKGPQVNLFMKIISLILFLSPIYLLVKGSEEQKSSLKILYIFFTASIVGILIANLIFKFTIYQYYFVVIWPVLFLLSAFSLDLLISRKFKWKAIGIMAIFFTVNIFALLFSRMKYPLNQKVKVADYIVRQLSDKPFSLQMPGNDIHLSGGGIGGILALKGHFPSNGNYYIYDWLYRAFSLYNIPVEKDDTLNQKVFVYPKTYVPNWTDYHLSTLTASLSIEKVNIAIFK